ncbi:MAG TPA: hypothetical protein VGF48_08220 [Thermoanaerobaculia bacterium]|jgi:hypothetical protein
MPQEYEYRWELRNRRNVGQAEDIIIDTNDWQASNTYTCQLREEGIWLISYIARKRDGSGQEIHAIDDVLVRNQAAATAQPPAEGRHEKP